MSTSDQITSIPEELSLITDPIERIDAMYRISNSMRLSDTEYALKLARELLHEAENISYVRGIALGKLSIGNCLTVLQQNDSGLPYLQEALGYFTQSEDQTYLAATYYSIAAASANLGNLPQALEDAHCALDFYKTTDDSKGSFRALCLVGALYGRLGDNKKALEYQLSAHKMQEVEHDAQGMTITLISLGITYQRLGNYTKAVESFFEAVKTARDSGSNRQEATALANVGSTYGLLGNHTVSIDYLFKALKLHEQNGNLRSQANALDNIADQYRQLREPAQALTYSLRSLKLFQSVGDRFGEGLAMRTLGHTLQQIKDYDAALSYLLRSLSLIEVSGERFETAFCLLLLGDFFFERGSIEEARSYFERGITFSRANYHETEAKLHERLIACYEKLQNPELAEEHRKAYLTITREQFSEEQLASAKDLIAKLELEQALVEAERNGIATTAIQENIEVLLRASQGREQPAVRSLVVPPTIQIQTFGRFALLLNGKEISNEMWQRKKARDVFKVLLLNHRRAVTIDELIDKIWGNSSLKNPEPALWNATSCIRKVLEPELKPQNASKYLTIADRTYQLDLGEEASVDFIKFKRLITQSQSVRNLETREELLRETIELYRGDFLKEDMNEEWASFERMLLKEQYIDALMRLATISRDRHATEDVLRYCKLAIEADATYEQAYELLFQTLREQDRLTEAIKLYEQCERAFQSELGAKPPKHLARLVARGT